MKINRYQVGDWVIPRIYDSKSEPSKIVGVHYNSYKGKDYVDWVDCEVWDELSLDDVEPIPLTPEILEKNGFLRDGESWWYKDFRVVLYTSKGFSLICNVEKKFKYVHELQQAMRICGIEKEIEL